LFQIGTLLVWSLLISGEVGAQVMWRIPCTLASDEKYSQYLHEVHGEYELGRGSIGGGDIIVYINPDKKTFSVTIQEKDVACMLVSGKNWVWKVGNDFKETSGGRIYPSLAQ
jgi:hypothetical protein